MAASDAEYDDVSDLGPDEIASAKEWEEQFKGTRFSIPIQLTLSVMVCNTIYFDYQWTVWLNNYF